MPTLLLHELILQRRTGLLCLPNGATHGSCTSVRGKKTQAGYPHKIHVYQAQRCEGCPLRGMCHKAKTDRIIRVNQRNARYRQQARQRLNSLRGIRMRQKRGIDTEPVFTTSSSAEASGASCSLAWKA
ncbi:MAG: transposase [Lewinellaceae bacterium]|nr:transposase [Lewinellaceae bacterium]